MLSKNLKFMRNEVTSKIANKMMLEVIIAILPAVAAAIYFYRLDAVRIILASVITSIICEVMWNFLRERNVKFKDLSSVVTGLLFALILPSHLPVWIVVIGAAFSNVFVKSFFGGLGGNFMNPAAVGKVFLITSWAAVMAKPSGTGTAGTVTLMDKFLGVSGGNLGEVSILALLIGFVYLLIRRVISYRSTLSYVAFFALFSFVFSRNGFFMGDYTNVVNGAVLLSAVFMANDYITTPRGKLGQVIFGALCALLASIIMVYGYNPDGPYYAIILVNLLTPVIDYITKRNPAKEVVKV